MAWCGQEVGGVRRNKGEAGGYVLQLGAASHCGVGIPTAQLNILQLDAASHCGVGIPIAQLHILQLGAASHCGVGSPQHNYRE